MIPNLRYQGTRDFNPQMGQQVQGNPNSHADELLLKVTEMMNNAMIWYAHTQNGMIWLFFLQITGFQSLLSSLVKTVQAQ